MFMSPDALHRGQFTRTGCGVGRFSFRVHGAHSVALDGERLGTRLP